jgi:hypothetical protein
MTQMIQKNIDKIYLPVGLIALVIAFGVDHFIKLPEFLKYFLIGVGGVWVVFGVIKQWNRRRE